MWIAVRERFRRLDTALVATQDQIDDAATKVGGILACLNSAYYGASGFEHGRVVGSWGKSTQIVHTEDVDLLFEVPYATYTRFAAYQTNGQSALLQEVKGVIEATYSTTTMRGDGQVVVVAFNSLTVEVIPAVRLESAQFWICDTHDGGSWKLTDPTAQIAALNTADMGSAGNTRRLIRMIKAWKHVRNVPIKAFQIELLVTEFMAGYGNRENDFYWFDWFVRDFFAFLRGRANRFAWVPGTNELVFLGDAWLPATERAYSASLAACANEYVDLVAAAGDEWQKVFGATIDRTL